MDELETICTLCELREKYGIRFRFEKEGMILTKTFQPENDYVVPSPIKFSRLFPLRLLECFDSDLTSLVEIFNDEAKHFFEKKTEG